MRFVAIGGLCAAFFFLINFLLLQIIELPLLPALALTYAICFGVGYTLQRNVAFRSSTSHRRSLPRYFLLHCAGMLIVYFLTLWLTPFFSLGSLGPSAISTGLAGIASFIISLTWVFSEKPDLAAQTTDVP
ncbi:MAG: GtrA family protein [Pseudorhodoplanes sp.]